MCSMSVLCPLCSQTSFTSIDALRNSLIKAANGPLACPICSDLFLGLDKLTIHLFSHTNLMTHDNTIAKVADVPKNFHETKSKSKSPTTTTTANDDVALKKSTDEDEKNMIFEKKKKRTKHDARASTKMAMCKEVQQENNNCTSIASIQHNYHQQQHLVVDHSDLNQLSTCDICEFTFRNEQLRDMHFRLVHQNSPKLTMSTMPLNASPSASLPSSTSTTLVSNSTSGAAVISTINEPPAFKCHLCAKTFKMKGSLRVHLKVVHMIGVNYVNNSTKLGICDRIRHKEVRNNANSKLSTLKAPAQPLVQSLVATPQNSLQQSTVLVSSPIQRGTTVTLIGCENQMPQHQTSTSIAVAENVLLAFPSQNGEIIIKESQGSKTTPPENPKIWECDVCSKSFTTKYFLKKHKRLHTGEMPYSCDICARTFTFQQSYHKHLLYHSDEKPHICAICGRAFKELSTLHNHERIHSGEKPFKCEICGKCFRQRVSFLVHTRIHTGVMPYKCDICLKNFRYKVSLRTHKCQPTTSCGGATMNSQDVVVATSPLPPSTTTAATTEIAAPVQTAPEGVSDHLTENFIKAFLESANSNSNIQNESQNSPASLEIAAITHSTCLEQEKLLPKSSVEALLSKTIDDIVVESCNKLGIGTGTDNTTKHLNPSPSSGNGFGIENFSDGSSSPLQKLQFMRLHSPKFDIPTSTNDEFSQFPSVLFNNSSNGGQ